MFDSGLVHALEFWDIFEMDLWIIFLVAFSANLYYNLEDCILTYSEENV